MKLSVYTSEIPAGVISLKFNNYSFPPTFTGHIFGMRENISLIFPLVTFLTCVASCVLISVSAGSP